MIHQSAAELVADCTCLIDALSSALSTCVFSSALQTCLYAYRPAGWPWGEAGLVDTPSPHKHKKRKGGRRKRSSSPVSRDASHLSGTDTDTDASKVDKPAAKRAKSAAGVGHARVVKRPVRKGNCSDMFVVGCCKWILLWVLTMLTIPE